MLTYTVDFDALTFDTLCAASIRNLALSRILVADIYVIRVYLCAIFAVCTQRYIAEISIEFAVSQSFPCCSMSCNSSISMPMCLIRYLCVCAHLGT